MHIVAHELGGAATIPTMTGCSTTLEHLAEMTGERLARIETDLAALKAQSAQCVTKADLTRAKAAIITWCAGAAFLAQLLALVAADLAAW